MCPSGLLMIPRYFCSNYRNSVLILTGSITKLVEVSKTWHEITTTGLSRVPGSSYRRVLFYLMALSGSFFTSSTIYLLSCAFTIPVIWQLAWPPSHLLLPVCRIFSHPIICEEVPFWVEALGAQSSPANIHDNP